LLHATGTHWLQPAPCLERFELLCTHQTNIVGVLAT